ncbi:MAG: septal ring lytic transglycosylase RlpA family protein [Bacillota bacterium]
MVKSITGIVMFGLLLTVYDIVIENYEPDCEETFSSPLCEVREIKEESESVKEVAPGELERVEAAPPKKVLFGDWEVKSSTGNGINVNEGWSQTGIASWYGSYFHDAFTASGETYDMYAMTAAHRKLPFNTFVEITCIDNNRSVVVRINDRGPYAGGERIIDLSKEAAEKLGIKGQGLAEVMIEVVDGP